MIIFTKGIQYMDVDEAMRRKENLSMEEKRGNYSQVWQYMAKIVLRASPEIETLDFNDYVQDRLGRTNGETFLAEFYPLPKPHANRFPQELVKKYGIKSVNHYYRDPIIIERRANQLNNFIRNSKNCKCVLGYGNDKTRRDSDNFISIYRKLEPSIKENDFKEVKINNMLFKYYSTNERIYFLTPFLGQGQFNN